MSIGLHLTWNFFQEHIFGFPVSGMKESPALIALQQNGPALWAHWRAGSVAWNDLLAAGSTSEYMDR
ncbi:MAG: hypothetical protein AB1649_22400 [Chloroflexota bacterium]